MFTNIKEFAESCETLRQARENAGEMSLVKEIGIYIVLFIILFIALSVAAQIEAIFDPNGTEDYLLLSAFIIVPVIVYLYATKIEKRSWRSIGFSKGNALSSTLKGFLIGFAMFFSVVIIGFALGQYTFIGFDFSLAVYIIPFFIGFVIQSFAEEIYARGWTLTYFSRRHSVLIGILASNIIFVLPHFRSTGIDLMSVINIFLVGTVFAVLFLRFDNIWICGGAHAAWNFSQGPIFGFNVSGMEIPSIFKFSSINQNMIGGGIFGPESSLIATVVFVVALILAVYYRN